MNIVVIDTLEPEVLSHREWTLRAVDCYVARAGMTRLQALAAAESAWRQCCGGSPYALDPEGAVAEDLAHCRLAAA